jgi:hypothetical protein
MTVTPENVLPGQHDTFIRQVHVTMQADNSWHRVLLINSPEKKGLRFSNKFGFAQVNQQKRFRNGTDAKRTVILI